MSKSHNYPILTPLDFSFPPGAMSPMIGILPFPFFPRLRQGFPPRTFQAATIRPGLFFLYPCHGPGREVLRTNLPVFSVCRRGLTLPNGQCLPNSRRDFLPLSPRPPGKETSPDLLSQYLPNNSLFELAPYALHPIQTDRFSSRASSHSHPPPLTARTNFAPSNALFERNPPFSTRNSATNRFPLLILCPPPSS